MASSSTKACNVKVLVDVSLQWTGTAEFMGINITDELHKLSQLDTAMLTRIRPSLSSFLPCMYTNVSNNWMLQGLEKNVILEQII